MSAQQADYTELPDHVRRIIERDGEIEFTPPSFERWLGRLQMLRTIAAMGSFVLVFLSTWNAGNGWETATVHGIIAAIVFHFFGWAAGLLIFGEMYDAEVREARRDLEEKERERQRRIEAYYRDRLRQQAGTGSGASQPAAMVDGAMLPIDPDDPLSSAVPGYIPTEVQGAPARRAA